MTSPCHVVLYDCMKRTSKVSTSWSVYCLSFWNIFSINGMDRLGICTGPCVGKGMIVPCWVSGLMTLLNARAPKFTLYGDKGYPIQPNLIAPDRGIGLTQRKSISGKRAKSGCPFFISVSNNVIHTKSECLSANIHTNYATYTDLHSKVQTLSLANI